jgi:hypothetical protein
MININLYRIFTTLTEKEWQDLVLYIKSHDAISRRKFLPLILELKKYNKKMNVLKEVSVSEIFLRIYGKTVKARTMFNRQNELLNLTKEFLKNNAYKKDELLQTNLYYNELISRNIINLFSREFNKKKDFIENNYYNENSYKMLSNIIRLKGDYFKLNGENDNSINAHFISFDILLAEILTNLYKTCQQIQICRMFNITKNSSLLNFTDYIDSDKFFEELESQNEPIFIVPLIHYYIFKSLQNLDSHKYISKAKRIFFLNETRFSEEFKIQIYNMIMSHYDEKVNRGEQKYYRDLFLLFKRKLKNNIVSDISYCYAFDNNIFREYVIVGILSKQFKWTEMVIKKYSPLLPESIRKDEYTLSMSRLFSAKGEHEKVIETIGTHKINNKLLYLDSVRLIFKSLFELQNYEECYKEIDNARHYINNNRKKILKVEILSFKQFINGFSLLLNYYTNPYNKDVNSIYYELEKSGISTKEQWIYKKFQEISRKK